MDKVPPKSKVSQALIYAQNQKEGLMNYLKDGNCSISNNLAENSIRPFTVGRKNWLFANIAKGANASAIIYSIVETAKENGLNPFKYFQFISERLPNMDLDDSYTLDALLPWSTSLPDDCKL